MLTWQHTRNTYEAAALCALGIGVSPVFTQDHKTGKQVTDYNLALESTPQMPGDPIHKTGELRARQKDGTLAAADPLHPYLEACRAMHNRERMLEAQKGMQMMSVEAAAGAWILKPGPAPQMPAGTATITTIQFDTAIALIGRGSVLMKIEHNGRDHVYTLSRCSLPTPVSPVIDNGPLFLAAQNGTLFPEHRHTAFGIQMHALHCLREIRRLRDTERFIIVQHKTPFHRGAAFNQNAKGDALGHVQKTLGVKI